MNPSNALPEPAAPRASRPLRRSIDGFAPGAVAAISFGTVLAGSAGWRWADFVSSELSVTHALSAAGEIALLAEALALATASLGLLVHARRVTARRIDRVVEERTRELRHDALHDVLTGLPNRQLVRHRAHEILSRSRSNLRTMMACLIDLDNFKEVNDTFGHLVGDQLLSAVAGRLSAELAGSGTIGRLGGDEFIVLAEGQATFDGPNGLAGRILSVFEEPFCLPGSGSVSLSVSASVGVAMGPRNDFEDLFRDADIALYRAKEAGRRRFVVFEPYMFREVIEHQALMSDLRTALERGEFALVYQPIIDLRTGAVEGAEALLRWHHDERGTVAPLDFIAALEESGLILDVGRFVLREAVRKASSWRTRGRPLQLAVNVSARQLSQESFVEDVRAALRHSGLPPASLTLEITESALVADDDLPGLRLRELKALGVSLAVDDFGTGYASISYLRRFPFDILKIDQSYLHAIGSDENRTLLDALVDLGHAIGLTIIAEGIIERDQLRHLVDHGCYLGQGYGFARPMSAEDFAAILDRRWRPAFFDDERATILSFASTRKPA